MPKFNLLLAFLIVVILGESGLPVSGQCTAQEVLLAKVASERQSAEKIVHDQERGEKHVQRTLSNQDLAVRVGRLERQINVLETKLRDYSDDHHRLLEKEIAALAQVNQTLQNIQGTTSKPSNEEQGRGKFSLADGSVFAAVGTFLFGTFMQLALKRADTALEYSRRYHEALKSNELQDNYLFWSIQHQEFTSWRKGLLPDETYQFWVALRIIENARWTNNGTRPHEWNSVCSKFVGTEFYDFMEKAFACVDEQMRTAAISMDIMKNSDAMGQAKVHARNLMREYFPWSTLLYSPQSAMFLWCPRIRRGQ